MKPVVKLPLVLGVLGLSACRPGSVTTDNAPVGAACKTNAECESGVCNVTCQAPTCSDSVRNGHESDVDCGGGTCAGCATGMACQAPADCATGVCADSFCSPPTCSSRAVGDGALTLDWAAPTAYVDGSPLIVASYRVYWGNASLAYVGNEPHDASGVVCAGTPAMCNFVQPGFSEGTYYLSVTALDSMGNESLFSNEACITLQ